MLLIQQMLCLGMTQSLLMSLVIFFCFKWFQLSLYVCLAGMQTGAQIINKCLNEIKSTIQNKEEVQCVTSYKLFAL